MAAVDASTALLMAAGGAVTGIGGLFLSRLGQRDTARQAQAATKLAERVQSFDEMESVVATLKGQVADALQQLKAKEIENDRRNDEQGRRCRVALDHALDTIGVLQNIVRDEIEKEAAEVVKATARRHRNTDHSASRGRDDDQPKD